MALGVIVRDVVEVTPTSAPTDTGQWFIAGLAQRGPADRSTRITSLNQFRSVFGERVSYSPLNDMLETFFREGGGVAHVVRVVGPSAATAEVTLPDDELTPADSILVAASSPGGWGDDLEVTIAAGASPGTFTIEVLYDGTAVERSPELDSPDAAEAWSADSPWVRVTALGDENPDTVTAQALTGGDDDRANATDTQWEDALEVFSRGLGPGQVSYAGRTSATAHQQLLEHAAANNRVALLDALNSSDVLDLTDVPGDAVTDPDQARFGAAFAPWIRIPGVAASTTRIVPPSALVAGLIARSDAVQTPNQPAAGENGVARWALGPEHTFTDSTYSDLHDANLNMVRLVAGQPRVYGWRSLESKDLARWWQFNTSRLRMLVQAELEVIGERYMFRQVDGRGAVLAAFSGEITSMLLGQYEAGAIYGDTPGEAFRVDVGPSVNSPEDLAQGRVGAVAAIRPSPHGELIEIELVRRSITEPV